MKNINKDGLMQAITVSGQLDIYDPNLGASGKYKDVKPKMTRVPIPKHGEDEVLVRIINVSVCGSDYHLLTSNHLGRPVSSCPTSGLEKPGGLILGHEFSGEVVAVGSKVKKDFTIGQLITAESVIPCRRATCNPCNDHNYNYCTSSSLVGFQQNGCFAEYAVLPASSCHSLQPLSDVFGTEAATVLGTQIEPLAVSYHSIRASMSNVQINGRGPTIRVLGAGPVGAYIALILRSMGYEDVICEEPLANRRDLVSRFAASEQPGKKNNQPSDYVFDCFGCSTATLDLTDKISAGGAMVFLARAGQTLSISVDNLMSKGLSLHGVRGHVGFMTDVIKMICKKSLNPNMVITKKITGISELYKWLLTPERFLQEGKVICKIS
jgi:threonine dehydrogenase-like Zn-dependent dehydrogenase